VLAQLLGRRIATLRKQSGFTQEQFAEAAGYSVEFISLVERGVNSPTVAGIEKMAQVLKAEPKELFTFGAEEKLK
jgi:transcriptional regulator with XRE-family HTH domain